MTHSHTYVTHDQITWFWDFFQIKLFHNIHCTKCFSSFCYLGYFLSAYCWSLLIIIKVSWYLGNSLMRHITSMQSQCWLSGYWLWLAVLPPFADQICFKFCVLSLNLYTVPSWIIQHEVQPVIGWLNLYTRPTDLLYSVKTKSQVNSGSEHEIVKPHYYMMWLSFFQLLPNWILIKYIS